MARTGWTYTLAALPLVLVLGGCQPKAAEEASDEKVAVDLLAVAPGVAGAAATAITVPQLAYDYDYTFTAGATGVESLLKTDQAACDRAGVAACQMISLRSHANQDAGYVNKTLELRVTPQWLKAWQGGLDAKIKTAGGRISHYSVSSEDLSLQIVDTEARLKNKEALRDRLAEIVRTRPGKISELVEAEAQLSQAQADIDAGRSALAVMQKRVATVHVTLNYESDGVAASKGTFAPVTDALKNFLGIMMAVIGAMIQVLAVLLPLSLVIVPTVWWLRRTLKRRKAAAAAEASATAAATPDSTE